MKVVKIIKHFSSVCFAFGGNSQSATFNHVEFLQAVFTEPAVPILI